MIYHGIVSPYYLEGWGDGEWQTEPDLEIWDPTYPGMICIIKRDIIRGFLKGYVGVSLSHQARLKLVPPLASLRTVANGIHGGITFAGYIGDVMGIMDVVDEHDWLDSYYYYGFECSRNDDFVPGFRYRMIKNGEKYRNWNYVKVGVERLAQQINCLKGLQKGLKLYRPNTK